MKNNSVHICVSIKFLHEKIVVEMIKGNFVYSHFKIMLPSWTYVNENGVEPNEQDQTLSKRDEQNKTEHSKIQLNWTESNNTQRNRAKLTSLAPLPPELFWTELNQIKLGQKR